MFIRKLFPLSSALNRSVRLILALAVALTLLVSTAAHAQTFTALHEFSGTDGYQPYGTLIRDNAGNMYGTTFYSLSGNGSGTVFQLRDSHGGWLFNSLYEFTVPYGAGPYSGVVFGPGGAIFGATSGGGTEGAGTVYATLPPSNPCRAVSCPWSLHVVYNFAGGTDGAVPWLGSLIYDGSANLYGTTLAGGPPNDGVVFKVARVNGNWTETVLHSFTGGNDGSAPYAGVTMDRAGNLYGTTIGGGSSGCSGHGCGTVYKLTPSGSGWTETVLYRFTDANQATDGINPTGGVIVDGSGNLFGTTTAGGTNQGGTVFELSPSEGSWNFTVLASPPLACCNGGPTGNLAMDASGALYGVSTFAQNDLGQVFKLAPQNGSWTYTVLHQFTGGPDGQWPYGGVILDANGNLFGTASEGGAYQCDFEVGCGTVWEITP